MNREAFFWDSILKLSSLPKTHRPITRNELNILYDTLEDIHGFWEAGNFVKLCAHLKDCTVQETARAAIDLKNNHFMYEDTIINEKRKVSSAPPRRMNGHRHSFHNDFYHQARRTENVARYPEHKVGAGTPEMREFLSQHFMHLTERQKHILSDLRPWTRTEPGKHIQ